MATPVFRQPEMSTETPSRQALIKTIFYYFLRANLGSKETNIPEKRVSKFNSPHRNKTIKNYFYFKARFF